MKRIAIVTLMFITLGAAQCLLTSRFGMKAGITYSSFSPDDGSGTFSGLGFHFGVGMGTDILNVLAIDMTPMVRTTTFGRTVGSLESTLSYTNLFLPVQLSIKAGMLPLAAPYIGFGVAGNFQLSGTARYEIGTITPFEYDIDSEYLQSDFFLIGALGVDIKLIKIHIIPEISLNYNLTPDIPNAQYPNLSIEGDNIDIHFSTGVYFSP